MRASLAVVWFERATRLARSSARRLNWGSLALLCCSVHAACGDRSLSSEPSATSAVAEASSSAVPSGPATNTAPPAKPTHDPSWVPPIQASAKAVAPPIVATTRATLRRLPPSPGSRSDVRGTVSHVGRSAVVLVDAAKLHVISVDDGSGLTLDAGATIASFEVYSEGRRLAAADATGRVSVWDLPSEALLFEANVAPEPANQVPVALGVSRSGAHLVVVGTEMVAFDLAARTERWRIPATSGVDRVTVGEELVATTEMNLRAHAWSLRDGATRAEVSFDTGATFQVTVSPDARFAAGSAPAGHGLQAAGFSRPDELRQLIGDTTCDAHIFPRFSADSKLLVARGGSRWVRAFDAASFAPHATYRAPDGWVLVADADDLSRVLVYDTLAKRLRIVVLSGRRQIELAQPKRVSALGAPPPKDASNSAWAEAHESWIFTFSSDGALLVGAGPEGISVWNAADGRVTYRLEGPR
jgi:hypothetical protein